MGKDSFAITFPCIDGLHKLVMKSVVASAQESAPGSL